MQTFIVTEINTTIEIQILTKFSRICRQQTIPFVIIHHLGHNHLWSCRTGHIQFVNRIIVECTIWIAKFIVHISIRCSIPFGTISRSSGTTISITTSNRSINSSTQTWFMINLPQMIQWNLRLVIRITTWIIFLSFTITKCRVVTVSTLVAHILLYTLPFFNG